MNYFTYLIFFFLSLGQLERISFLDQYVNIYLHEVIILFIIIFYAIRIILIKKAKLCKKITSIEKAILIFLSILLLSFINGFAQFTLSQNTVGFLYFGRLCMYFLFFFTLTHWNSKNNEQSQKVICKGIIMFSILTIIFSYLQYFLYPNLRNLSYLGWDPHYYRVFGLYFDTSTAGILYVMLFFWLTTQKCPYKRFVRVSSISLIILILLTYSRIAYITFIVSVILFFLKKASLFKISLFICGIVVLIFILPRPSGYGGQLTRTYTINARMNDYKKGLMLWLKKPIIGYGYNRIRYLSNRPHTFSHAGASFPSSYLTILVSSGLVGLFSFLFLFYSLFRYASHNGKLLVFIVAFSSLFDNIFLNNFVMTIFFMMLTIA